MSLCNNFIFFFMASFLFLALMDGKVDGESLVMVINVQKKF